MSLLLLASLVSIPAQLSPNTAVVLATLGFGLILLELNRPGLILAGALGILCVLFAAAFLGHGDLDGRAGVGLLLCMLVLLANVWAKLPLWLLVLATGGLVAGLRFLVATGPLGRVSLSVAIVCGFCSGAAAASLSRVALRARRAKQVN